MIAFYSRYRTLWLPTCGQKFIILTTFPIPDSVFFLDSILFVFVRINWYIVTILPRSLGSHNIRYLLYTVNTAFSWRTQTDWLTEADNARRCALPITEQRLRLRDNVFNGRKWGKAEVHALRHERRILGQLSIPVSGSRKSQASSLRTKQHRAQPVQS